MRKIILTGKHGRPSTKLVWSYIPLMEDQPILVQRRIIKKKTGIKQYYRVFNNPTLYKEHLKYQQKALDFNFDNCVIIRWGSTQVFDYTNSIIYNKSRAIQNATDKKLSRQIFTNNNVSTPRLITSIENYNGGIVIGRPPIHSKGKNFIVINNIDELRLHWKEDWYYSEFVNKVREFRVHCGHSKVIAFMEKHKPSNGSIAWNRAINGTEPFTQITQKQSDEQNLLPVLQEAIKAVQILGLDMGGVDVILDSNNKAYVLEVNTAPTLNSSLRVAEMWSKYWGWLLREDKRRQHWDYTQFKKASSLFWKLDQLSS